MLYDFVEDIENAEVELVVTDGSKPCSWMSAPPAPGGLGHGPMTPTERFVCDPQRPWLWVGATVLQDLELQPRRCIWQHPAGADPVRVTFSDVPLGERLVRQLFVAVASSFPSGRRGTVGNDPVQPRAELCVTSETIEASVGPQVGVLHHISSILLIAREAPA